MYVADEYYLKYNEVLYDNFKRVNLIYSLKKKMNINYLKVRDENTPQYSQ